MIESSDKANEDESDEPFWSFRNPIAWGLGITIVFMGFVAVLAFGSHCSQGSCSSRLAVFLASKPNEIGDSLAGISSTVAFVWIVVTVWIQSQELREQRRELKAQRKEFEQVNKSMNQQTKIFEGEERKRRQGAVFSAMNGQIRAALDALNDEVGNLRWEASNLSTGQTSIVDLVPAAIEVDRTKDDYPINDASLSRVLKLVDDLHDLAEKGDLIEFTAKPKKSIALQTVTDLIKRIVGTKDEMSENSMNRVTLMRFESRHEMLQKLLSNQRLWS